MNIAFADDPNKLCNRIKIIPCFAGVAASRQAAIRMILNGDPFRLEARPQPFEHALYHRGS